MRNTSLRVGNCAVVGVLAFLGLAAWGGGNALVAVIEFTLAGLVFGTSVALARQGRL